MRQKGQGLIVNTGSRQDHAILLKAGGDLVATAFGISRAPNEFDPPIEGVRYLEIAQRTLDKLQKAIEAKQEAERKRLEKQQKS